MHPETDVIHRSEGVRDGATPLITPIYATSTFVFASAAELEQFQQGKTNKYIYSRYANPSVQSVEEKLAALEGADSAMVTSSGMAAIATALFGLLKAGDEVICSAAIYGGTLQMITKLLEKFGVTARFASLDDLANPDRILSAKTKVVWFESPINPTLRCIDIRKVATASRARGVVSILDSTFASPINQRPIAFGVDLVMHSATKYLNGHSDVTAGALIGSTAMVGSIEKVRRRVGTIMDPQPAYLLGRGLKTLDVRVRRQNASAMAVAEWLAKDSRVETVYYPGLPQH